MRQPPVYFPLGGGTLSGVTKPGAAVWSRVFLMDGRLHVDLGRASAMELPEEETRRRLAATTHQGPIMHAVLHGVTRDQFMARHQANHLDVAYAPTRRPRTRRCAPRPPSSPDSASRSTRAETCGPCPHQRAQVLITGQHHGTSVREELRGPVASALRPSHCPPDASWSPPRESRPAPTSPPPLPVPGSGRPRCRSARCAGERAAQTYHSLDRANPGLGRINGAARTHTLHE
jgi:hypothetical protein